MNQVKIICNDCGREAAATISENIVGDELRWAAQYSCAACGCGRKSQGKGLGLGFPPLDVWNALLAQHGQWELSFAGEAVERKLAAAMIESIVKTSFAEARRRSLDPANFLAFGTRTEMEWLANALRKQNLPAIIRGS